MKCAACSATATKKVIWADGRAYQPSCDQHVKKVQQMLTAKNGEMTELAGVQDLSDRSPLQKVIDLVSSRVYPGLERKPGGPDNWVEAARGLPAYIERIAKHLHYERGFSISHAIATAVNTVKRWARGGHVTKHGTRKRVSAKTIAQAAAAVASWEAKRRAGALALTEALYEVIDLTEVSEEFAFDLLDLVQDDTSGEQTECATLLGMDIQELAERANQVSDPEKRATARQAVLDLAVPKHELTAEKRRQRAKSGQAMPDGSFPIFDATSLKSAIRLARTPEQRAHVKRRAKALGLSSMIPDKWDMAEQPTTAAEVIDLASTIAPRNPAGKAKDGRRRYKRQGKWGHGFVPLDQAAKESKAKGSPIAIKRLNRIYGGKVSKGRSGNRSAGGRKQDPHEVKIDERTRPGSERAKDIGHLRHSSVDANTNQPPPPLKERQKESTKQSRIPERARQNWDEIPEALKTVRGGKRYVLAEFGGKQYVTEWLGGIREQKSTDLNKRKVMRTITMADALKMSPGDITAMINNPRTPDHVKKLLRRSLKERRKAGNDVG